MEVRRIGPYRLERKLGAGGMGIVYAAWDERLERRVALKQIRPELAGDALRRERLRREARAVARLDHPSIVRIHDLLETPEGDWLVLQYVDGPTLAERRREGPLPAETVVAIARDVLGALAAAHAEGLLHRDLKAENVVLAPSGRVMVLDFGLAKLYAPDSGAPLADGLPRTAGIIGTYRAMSPEQANGLPLDPRSDLFSLGVLLYEAATGISPFLADTTVSTLTRVCTQLQRPARELVPALPAPISALIDALLEKDASRRPQSAGEALARLAAATGATPPPAAPPADEPLAPTVQEGAFRPLPAAPATVSTQALSIPPYRGLRPRRLPLAAGLALAAAALGGLLAVWRLRSPPPPPPREPLYVAVARPEIGLGAGREEVALAAAALQAAALRALAALDGVAALPAGPPEPGERPPTVQRLSKLLAAQEVVAASLDCQAQQCQAVLRRQRGSDGKVLAVTAPFEVPLADLHLLDTAAATYVKPLYAGFGSRQEGHPLQVRDEDYQRFLRARRSWEEERPADLAPLLSELDGIHAGSPLFLDAYLLEARIFGHRFFQTRDPQSLARALALLDEARRLAPGDPQQLDARFDVALLAGRLDEAEETLRELEQRLPGDVDTLERRALLSEQRGNRQQSLRLLGVAAERHPSAAVLLALAKLEMRLGETAAARGTLEDLLRRLPGHLAGETLLAQLELETGSPARAAELYAGLARRHPGFAVFSNLGLSQLLLGRYAEATASLERAYALAPQAYSAALNLGDVEALLGRRAAAESLYRRGLALASRDPAPGDWQVLAARAQAAAHLGRRAEAAALIQQAVVAAPDNPELAYDAALVYAVVGDTASALASAGRALGHGYDRRWFALPWFDSLRRDPAFRSLLAEPAAAASPPASPSAAR